MAERTRGRSRASLSTDPRRAAYGARLDRIGDVAGLISSPAGGTDEESWVVTALRAGLSARCDPMPDFVRGLDLAARPRLEASATAAVAAAVSAAVDGCALPVITSLAVMAADEAADLAEDTPGPDFGARLQWACALAARTEDDPDEILDLLVGTSGVVQECVPAAFGFLTAHTAPAARLSGTGSDGAAGADGAHQDDAGSVPAPGRVDLASLRSRGHILREAGPAPDLFEVCVGAAELGGASEVVAVVVGVVLGAMHGPEAVPADIIGDVDGSWPSLREVSAELATSR